MEVEFTKEMCEAVLGQLQSTWELSVGDLTRVAKTIDVEPEVGGAALSPRIVYLSSYRSIRGSSCFGSLLGRGGSPQENARRAKARKEAKAHA